MHLWTHKMIMQNNIIRFHPLGFTVDCSELNSAGGYKLEECKAVQINSSLVV